MLAAVLGTSDALTAAAVEADVLSALLTTSEGLTAALLEFNRITAQLGTNAARDVTITVAQLPGRAVTVTDPTGRAVTVTDAASRAVTVTDAAGRAVTVTDAVGRAVVITGPSIDPGGNVILNPQGVEFAKWTITADVVLVIPPSVSFDQGATWLPTAWADTNAGDLTRSFRILLAGNLAPASLGWAANGATQLAAGRYNPVARVLDTAEAIVRPAGNVYVGT